jgi:hypothetical protein
MSLDKAIQHKKEKRQPYRKSKAIDASCRNHGGCPYCESNRAYHDLKAELSADEREEEYTHDTSER